MPAKEYEVSGTVYEFPDNFDDAKVKDILTQQGIIKNPTTAEKLGKREQFPPLESLTSESPFLQRSGSAMKGLREGKPADFLGNLGAAGYEFFKPELNTLAIGGGAASVGGAASAVAKGSFKPALGIASGLGTGWAVDKTLQGLGAPPWMAETLATLAGAGVAGKVGASEKVLEALRSGGIKGLVKKILVGEKATDQEAYTMFEQAYGRPPAPGKERLQAKAEAQAFAQKIRDSLKPKLEPKATKEPEWKPFKGGKSDYTPGGPAEPYNGGKGARKPDPPWKQQEDTLRRKQETQEQDAYNNPHAWKDTEPAARAQEPPPVKPTAATGTSGTASSAPGTREPNRTNPATGEPDVDPRGIGFDRLKASAIAKTNKIADHFVKSNITIEDVERMPKAELNEYAKKLGFKPFEGKHMSRTPEAGKLDIIKAMQAMQGAK